MPRFICPYFEDVMDLCRFYLENCAVNRVSLMFKETYKKFIQGFRNNVTVFSIRSKDIIQFHSVAIQWVRLV